MRRAVAVEVVATVVAAAAVKNFLLVLMMTSRKVANVSIWTIKVIYYDWEVYCNKKVVPPDHRANVDILSSRIHFGG